MTRKEHNGWTNYETWLVKFWIDNDQSLSERWADRAGELAVPAKPDEDNVEMDDAIRTLATGMLDEAKEVAS